MKKTTLALALLTPFAVQAETVNLQIEKPQFYGRISVAYQSTYEVDSDGDELNFSKLVSNNSRLGLQGAGKLEHGLTAIYQLEYQVAPDSGVNSNTREFSQRNSFIGIKGGFGEIKAGHYDTPLKLLQNKIDLFNDLEGDITSIISTGEIRSQNSVMYTTPVWQGLQVNASRISAEDKDRDEGIRKDATSVSLSYTRGSIYLGVAQDTDVEADDVDLIRAVVQYSIGPVQLGGLWEERSEDETTEGWSASALYNATSALALKAQYGESDNKVEDGESISLGLDYKLAKGAKMYVYATEENAPAKAKDASYYGVGLEYNF